MAGMVASSTWILVAMAACGGGTVTRAPSPAPPTTGRSTPAASANTTPCFAGGRPLVADEIHKRLEKHSWWWSQEEPDSPPPEAFGSCTVHRGKIRAADGTLVAELSCGVHILVRGIRDDVGIEIGARGADVMPRWTVPHGPLVCIGNGPDQTRCRYDRPDDGDTDFTTYIVAGALDTGTDALTGAAAESFFSSREVVEIQHSVWCH